MGNWTSLLPTIIIARPILLCLKINHIYWPQSSWSLTYSNSQPITNGSNTLLKWDVKEIIFTSSSLIGLFFFCSGVTYSVRHGFGQSPVCTMLRMILPAGAASSGANSFTIRRGKSPRTDDRVFFDRLIFSYTTWSGIPGTSSRLKGSVIFDWTFSGRSWSESGGNSWLILAKFNWLVNCQIILQVWYQGEIPLICLVTWLSR